MAIFRESLLDKTISPDFLFDSHCHLQFPEFDEDLDEVINRAKASKIQKVLIPATTYEDALKAIQIAQKYPDYIEVAIGNHPNTAHKSTPEQMALFSDLIKQHSCITAIGETGLDNVNCEHPLELQLQSLTKHAKLAYNSSVPLIIHTRETDELTDQVLSLLKSIGLERAVFHCFSGSLNTAKKVWERGYKTSFSGNITFKKNKELLEVAKQCPKDLLLLETDSPYLTPEPNRGKRNEPANIAFIAQLLWPKDNLEIDNK